MLTKAQTQSGNRNLSIGAISSFPLRLLGRSLYAKQIKNTPNLIKLEQLICSLDSCKEFGLLSSIDISISMESIERS